MRFYLAFWIGDGSELNPYRPNVGDNYAALDLRPDSMVQSGRVLVATPEPVASVPTGVLDIGDLAANLPRGVSRKLEDALGVTLDQTDTIQAVIAELLILHGDSRPRGSRTRWRPLKQDRRGWHRIVMFGETLYDAPAPVGATITDDFNRADADALGSSSEGWSWTEVTGDTDIVSNTAEVINPGGGSALNRAESDLAGDDHYAKATMAVTGSGATQHGPCVRFAASAQTFYHGRSDNSAGEFQIYEVTTGTFTLVSSVSYASSPLGAEPSEPFEIYLEADGSALDLQIDGASQLSTTDTQITGNTRTGFRTRYTGSSTNEQFDDFEAGDLAAFDPANFQATVDGSDVTLTHDASF